MKTITINYLSHNRINYSKLMFYFLSKIKPKNKDKLILNILATHHEDWDEKCGELGIDYNVFTINQPHNYMEKIRIATSAKTEYSVKLDEDCFMNNYVWDYLIDNVSLLNDNNILTLSPTMSNNIPSCDSFIENYIDDVSIKNKIYNFFIKRQMPNGLWGVDYTPLNQYTINSEKWDINSYYEGLDRLQTNTKGLHPLRISYESQMLVNEYIINNISKFKDENKYDMVEISAPYFTNSLFFIKTSEWINILNYTGVDSFDEIALNNYKRDKNKKFLFVKNGFGVHPMFNTVYGNKNPWGIGGEDGEKDELTFYNNLIDKII